jgi:hypothetical protein
MSDATLNARESTHGDYQANAHLAQQLKTILHNKINWSRLASDQQESLDLICTKIARILTGDPNHADSWHDIQGYARLVERRLLLELREQRHVHVGGELGD